MYYIAVQEALYNGPSFDNRKFGIGTHVTSTSTAFGCYRTFSPSACVADMVHDNIDDAISSHRPTNLLDLPPELLLHIISFLSDETLLRLSFVSNQLHYLAYPIYISPKLEQYSIDLNRISEQPLSLRSTTIQLLSRALWVKAICSLGYTLHYCASDEDPFAGVDSCTAGIVSFTKFISGLDAVHDVYLRHQAPPSPVPRWCDATLGLLGTLEGKGCRNLFLTASRDQCREREDNKVTLMSFKFDFTRTNKPLCSSRTLTKIREGEYTAFRPLTTLQSFTLNYSPLLVKSPFLGWTISTLNQSQNLTTLVLFHVSLTSYQWSQLLPLITMKSLASFTLSSSTLLFPDLIKFILRHLVTLVMLDLRNDVLELDKQSKLFWFPKLHLLRLTTLRATPDYICELLKPSIHIYPMLPLLGTVTIELFRKNSQPDLNEDAISRLFSSIGHIPRKKGICLCLTILGKSKSVSFLRSSSQSQLQPITHLRLRTWLSKRLSNKAIDLIPGWLAVFPSLRGVTFEADVLPFVDELDVITFVDLVKQVCPGIAEVRVLS
jgi:hypothetical protein